MVEATGVVEAVAEVEAAGAVEAVEAVVPSPRLSGLDPAVHSIVIINETGGWWCSGGAAIGFAIRRLRSFDYLMWARC